MRGKLSEPHFYVWLFSNPGEKVQKAREAMGQICPIIFLLFMTFSPLLETNNTLQCSSDSFPCMVTYIECGKLSELHFDAELFPNRGETVIECKKILWTQYL